MDSRLQNLFSEVTVKFTSYIPSLVAGIVLIAAGVVLGWVAKRIVIQTLAVLRIDRIFRRFTWGAPFSKADVRYAFLMFIGDSVFFVVFVILLKKALEELQLPLLSSILEQALLFVPKVIASCVLFGLGWLFAGWIAGLVQRALTREAVPRAALIAQLIKAVIILFCSAMALVWLNIARDIVIIGYTIVMATLGVLVIVLAHRGERSILPIWTGAEDDNHRTERQP